MNYFRLLIPFFVTVFITVFSYNSFAMDYCSPKGKKTPITLIIPQSFSSVDEKTLLLRTAHDHLKKTIKSGDFVNFSIAKKDSIKTVINECFPGCPPTGFLGQVLGLGTDCNATIMQKDKKIFDRTLYSPLPKINNIKGNIVKDGVEDIFASLESIAKFNKTKKYDDIYIISSMNPLKNNISDKEINSLFLNLVQNDKMPKTLPNATYIGITQNSKLILFWTDVFKALKMKFKYE